MSTRRLRTIGLISTLALGLLAAPLPTEAQEPTKVPRIGYLSVRGPDREKRRLAAVHQGLRELGYIEGQNLVIEYRYAEGKIKRYTDLAAELVRLKVDVIVTSPSPTLIRAAQRTTRTIPIVMLATPVDPVEAGFVVSLARPGGNVTGLMNLSGELHPKRLELLKEVSPQISRVAIIWSPRQQRLAMTKVEAAGQALGIQIQSLVREGQRLDELESAFSAISQERPDGLMVTSFRLTLRHRVRVTEFAAKKRLPTIYDNSIFVNAGGLMVYDADRQHLHRRAATYVDKILKGAKPGDLPVERPTKFVFEINLKMAKQLGVTIPPEVLYQATKVIK